MMVSVPIVITIVVVPGPSIVSWAHANRYSGAVNWRRSIHIRRRIICRCGDPYVDSDAYLSPARLWQHRCP